MTELRPELPDPPRRIAMLPVDRRGYPVPWFVAEVDGQPDHRIVPEGRALEAVKRQLCWVCGQPTGRHLAFVIGPMCVVNRITSEAPSHRECAEYSTAACPFLSRPHAVRRDASKPADAVSPGGNMLPRNPGVLVLWITRPERVSYLTQHNLFRLNGEPTETVWIREGRQATRAESLESIETGLPTLRELAEAEDAAQQTNSGGGGYAVRELEQQLAYAMRYLPA